MELSKAAQADKEAAELAFSNRIHDYALADAKGLAPEHIKQRLRSQRFHREWSAAIGYLRGTLKDKNLQKLLNDRAIEAAALKRQFNLAAHVEGETISKLIQKEIGVDTAGRTLHEIHNILLCEMIKELRYVQFKIDELRQQSAEA